MSVLATERRRRQARARAGGRVRVREARRELLGLVGRKRAPRERVAAVLVTQAKRNDRATPGSSTSSIRISSLA